MGRRGPGTREKVSSRRINLECNTYVHESNARNLPLPGSEAGSEREGAGEGGRNDPNIVCTYE
jgi:hypothetical protein